MKIPSKAKCGKILKRAFGPRTRFASLDAAGGLAVVGYTESGAEYHVAEVRPKTVEALAGAHWAATLAAFHTHGMRVEWYGDRVEVIDFEIEPGQTVADALDKDNARREYAAGLAALPRG